MEIGFTPEQERFRAEVRAFVKAEVPPEWAGDDMRHDGSDAYWAFSRSFGRRLAAKGWPTMYWPAEYGGWDATPTTSAIYHDELGYNEAPRHQGVSSGVSSLGSLVIAFGTDGQKQRFLPPVVRGEPTS